MTSPNAPNPLASIRSHWAAFDPRALTLTCEGSRRCSIDLRAAEAVCLDCDASVSFQSSDRRPDFIVATPTLDGRVLWVVVEMTTGGSSAKSASELHHQLQAGADMITHDEAIQVPRAELLPVVLHRKEKTVTAVQTLDRPSYEVSFGGRKLRIRRRFCGDTLAMIVAPTKDELSGNRRR